jgi:hypothetical protein
MTFRYVFKRIFHAHFSCAFFPYLARSRLLIPYCRHYMPQFRRQIATIRGIDVASLASRRPAALPLFSFATMQPEPGGYLRLLLPPQPSAIQTILASFLQDIISMITPPTFNSFGVIFPIPFQAVRFGRNLTAILF